MEDGNEQEVSRTREWWKNYSPNEWIIAICSILIFVGSLLSWININVNTGLTFQEADTSTVSISGIEVGGLLTLSIALGILGLLVIAAAVGLDSKSIVALRIGIVIGSCVVGVIALVRLVKLSDLLSIAGNSNSTSAGAGLLLVLIAGLIQAVVASMVIVADGK